MKKIVLIGLFAVLVIFVGQAFAADPPYSIQPVVGHSNGNHRLDCRVIRPWDSSSLDDTQYPVIAWANGWGQGNVFGAGNTAWYINEYLIDWALEGPYIVIAANAWSAREDDVLRCLQWIVDQDGDTESEYYGKVNTDRIGLAGHSQGAGAVIKAGDGEPNGLDITAVLAMNPYGPSWVSAGDQDGQVLVLTGSNDTVTPFRWTYPVFEALVTNGAGGWYAVYKGGGHSTLDLYQPVIKEWWDFKLNDNPAAGAAMETILATNPPWTTQYTDGFGTVTEY